MLPLLFLIGPPFAIGGSYLMWYSGQQSVLRLQHESSLLSSSGSPALPQGAASYSAGIFTLVGTYGLQSVVYVRCIYPQKTVEKQPYVPPKTMSDIFQRFGRPVLVRVGAGSVAFFCAGAVQTYVALRNKA